MEKEEIISHIESLYFRLSELHYDSWYKRDTLTPWEKCYEYDLCQMLSKEKDEFIAKL